MRVLTIKVVQQPDKTVLIKFQVGNLVLGTLKSDPQLNYVLPVGIYSTVLELDSEA